LTDSTDIDKKDTNPAELLPALLPMQYFQEANSVLHIIVSHRKLRYQQQKKQRLYIMLEINLLLKELSQWKS
jgi:hypothetical protein